MSDLWSGCWIKFVPHSKFWLLSKKGSCLFLVIFEKYLGRNEFERYFKFLRWKIESGSSIYIGLKVCDWDIDSGLLNCCGESFLTFNPDVLMSGILIQFTAEDLNHIGLERFLLSILSLQVLMIWKELYAFGTVIQESMGLRVVLCTIASIFLLFSLIAAGLRSDRGGEEASVTSLINLLEKNGDMVGDCYPSCFS